MRRARGGIQRSSGKEYGRRRAGKRKKAENEQDPPRCGELRYRHALLQAPAHMLLMASSNHGPGQQDARAEHKAFGLHKTYEAAMHRHSPQHNRRLRQRVSSPFLSRHLFRSRPGIWRRPIVFFSHRARRFGAACVRTREKGCEPHIVMDTHASQPSQQVRAPLSDARMLGRLFITHTVVVVDVPCRSHRTTFPRWRGGGTDFSTCQHGW